jgi:parallel beta-helix repeat protein
MKQFLAFGIMLLFIGMTVPSSTGINVVKQSTIVSLDGNTLYVGGSGPGNYTRIQDAVDNTSDGDTVFVYNGTYQERVTIEKAIKLLGEEKNTTIIDGRYSEGIIILIKSSNVTVHEFTLKNCIEDGYAQAFYLQNQSRQIENIYISDCIMKSNDKGIYFKNVADLSVSSCHIHHNKAPSIAGLDSTNITISDCIINNNGRDLGGGWISPGGILMDYEYSYCSNVWIMDCIIYKNTGGGVTIWLAQNVTIYRNDIYRNTWQGIYAEGANIVIHHNQIYENTNMGVFGQGVNIPGYTYDIVIHSNNISGNGYGSTSYYHGGIFLQGCPNCVTIKNNTISSNDKFGIYSSSSPGTNIIENDITGNTEEGIHLGASNNTIIKDNNVMNSETGLYIGPFGNSIILENIISNNEFGIELSSSHNNISGNEISNNDEGIHLRSSIKNTISRNNFLNNKRDVVFKYNFDYFPFPIHNIFNENYWNRPRILPKPIFGPLEIWFRIFGNTRTIIIPWVHFDWHPAREPYDIDGKYGIPVEKNFSWHESGEEYTKSSWIEESSGISGDCPLLWRYRCTNN